MINDSIELDKLCKIYTFSVEVSDFGTPLYIHSIKMSVRRRDTGEVK